MINIKNLDPSLLEINKLSCEKANINININIHHINIHHIHSSINIHHIEYITMRSLDHVNINSGNPLYLIFNNVDGYVIEESNRDKYLIFASTNKNK